jgi:hypothetical protein
VVVHPPDETHPYGVPRFASARESAAVRLGKEHHDRRAYITQPEREEGWEQLEEWEDAGPDR